MYRQLGFTTTQAARNCHRQNRFLSLAALDGNARVGETLAKLKMKAAADAMWQIRHACRHGRPEAHNDPKSDS
jgi:hypothetical protein